MTVSMPSFLNIVKRTPLFNKAERSSSEAKVRYHFVNAACRIERWEEMPFEFR